MAETWRPAAGYPGYEASDQGRIRSLDDPGKGRWAAGRVLTPQSGKDARVRVTLNGQLQLVHCIVLETFVGPRPPGMLGLHRDDVPSNNCLENLYWGTQRDNKLDSVRNGSHLHARKTECPQGHPYSSSNTAYYASKGSVARYCITCNRERNG